MAGRTRFRVGIRGSYGGLNLGDEAILSSIVKSLRERFPVEITVFTRDPEDTRRRHGVERPVKVTELNRDEAKAEVERLDLLILGGGGILFDGQAQDYLREVALAHETGVPVAVFAISAGPLETPQARELVAKHLEPAALITVRDKKAQKLLEEVGVRREIQLTADPALLLEPEALTEDALKREGLEEGRRLVGLSVREPGPAAPDIDAEHYCALLANTADYIVDRFDAEIVLVPMEPRTQDLQYSHAVVAKMATAQRAHVLKGDYSPGQILSMVGKFQLTVGMRLHFLIFSALKGIPFVALPYASKVEGFIADLEMPAPVLKKVTTGLLIAHVDRSWDNRSVLSERIAKNRPAMMERARQTTELVADLLTAVGQRRKKAA